MPPAPQSRLARLADLAFRRRRLVLLGWVVALVAAFAASGALAGEFSGRLRDAGLRVPARRRPARPALPDPLARHRRRRLAGAGRRRRGPRPHGRAPRVRREARRHRRRGPGARRGRLARRHDRRRPALAHRAARQRADPDRQGADRPWPSVRAPTACGSRWAARSSPPRRRGQLSSEAVGLMIAALVLVLTFGTLVAAGLPIATALFGLGISSAFVGPAGRGDGRARLVDRGREHDRPRRRHRLRAADPDPPPQRAGDGLEPARRGRRGNHDGRALRARGRDDRRHLAARPLPDGPHLPAGRRPVGQPRGARGDGRLGHAAARAARLRRDQGRPAADPGHKPARRRS